MVALCSWDPNNSQICSKKRVAVFFFIDQSHNQATLVIFTKRCAIVFCIMGSGIREVLMCLMYVCGIGIAVGLMENVEVSMLQQTKDFLPIPISFTVQSPSHTLINKQLKAKSKYIDNSESCNLKLSMIS